MNLQAIQRAASGVTATVAPKVRTNQSYGAVAAQVAHAQGSGAAALTGATAKPAPIAHGLPFPPGSGSGAVPPRPATVPGDWVYRGEMWLPPVAAAIYDAQAVEANAQAAQVEFWHTSTNPTAIEGFPLEQWSTAQLQAGLAYYSDLRTQAVPNSNEWLELTDRVNSIQANLDGNRSPWNYALSSAVNYWSPISSRQG